MRITENEFVEAYASAQSHETLADAFVKNHFVIAVDLVDDKYLLSVTKTREFIADSDSEAIKRAFNSEQVDIIETHSFDDVDSAIAEYVLTVARYSHNTH